MTDRVPVADWATDFDHTDPTYNERAFEIWADLRGRCPVARTERFGGAWLPTRHDDVSAIARDPGTYSSHGVVVSPVRPRVGPPLGSAPPVTSDPPVHAAARGLLLPFFGAKAVARREPTIRRLCRRLIDELPTCRGRVDAAAHYAQHVPVGVIADILGVPAEDGPRFRRFIADLVEQPERRAQLAEEDTIGHYLRARIAERRATPGHDLIDHLIGAEIGGQPLPDEHIVGTVMVLLIAGIETSWSALGSALWHLATHPDDRDRLAAEPELVSTAVEELLRAYAPVTMARIAVRDAELGGCPVTAGDWVLVPYPAANRDPEVFDDADRVVIDRRVNRHAAFGLGIHRCLGSHLARLELRVAIETWLAAFPRFSLDPEGEVRWSTGQTRGPRTLPVLVG